MSRRDQIRMTDEERKTFISETQTIVINSIGKDGVPHPMPMWFAIGDDGAILMTTFTKSQKIKNLERDPRVSLLLEDGTQYSELRGVVIYGTAELLRDTDAVTDILLGVGARESGGIPDASDEAVRAGMKSTAVKRTGIRVVPERVVSWDHRKLGGRY